MKYSLINCTEIKNGKAKGYWIQDCNGVVLDEAIRLASETKKVNGDRIEVAIVPQIRSTTPLLSFWENQQVIAIV